MARSQKSKTKHNSTVKNLAKKLENQGYQVKADIPGFSQPETIGGYRPDGHGVLALCRRARDLHCEGHVSLILRCHGESFRHIATNPWFRVSQNRISLHNVVDNTVSIDHQFEMDPLLSMIGL